MKKKQSVSFWAGAIMAASIAAIWSCYPDLNRRPHPYQLIGSPQPIAVEGFPVPFTPKG